MLCPKCKVDVPVLVIAEVVVTMPVIVGLDGTKTKINESAKVQAKIPENALCTECGAKMVNPIRDLSEWQEFLKPGGSDENIEQRISEV
jgi:hypothetical protein